MARILKGKHAGHLVRIIDIDGMNAALDAGAPVPTIKLDRLDVDSEEWRLITLHYGKTPTFTTYYDWDRFKATGEFHRIVLPGQRPVRNQDGKCPTTGKMQFDNETLARLRAKSIRKDNMGNTYPYVCSYCKLWHIGHNRPAHWRSNKAWGKHYDK